MTNSRVAVLTGAVAIMSAWLSSAAGTVPTESVRPAGTVDAGSAAQAVTSPPVNMELEREVARLAASLENAPRPRLPGRNPFMLAGPTRVPLEVVSRAQARPATPVAPVAIETPVTPPPPALSLAGIGAERTSFGRRRTAILSAGGSVVLARIGDEVLGQYQVRAVTEDAVELFDISAGTSLRLELP